ncbi:MAG: RsmB/NOP family class I SAM-dependent RNA methyltransferase [candidate division WOR-3 bacterium]
MSYKEELLYKNRELVNFLETFYGGEYELFLKAIFRGKKPSIRVNTIKIEREELFRRLQAKGFKLVKVPFYEDAFIVEESPVEIGNTVEHFMGYYYVQSLSSMIPPLLLDPKPGDKILDIASAPGSKTTQMAQMMKNQGLIVANDVDIDRVKALSNNIDRMGALCVIITIMEGNRFGKLLPDYFDKVLVDAPCSALGTLSKNSEILKWWGSEKIGRLMNTQKALILSGFDSLKPGGLMVYSTCTLTPHENEYIIDYLLQKRPNATIIDFDLPGVRLRNGVTQWGKFQFRPEVGKCKRIEPYYNENFEGFFIALITKLSSS